MKAIVTGSNGMVGRELVKKLRKSKVKVVEFSRSRGQDVRDLEALTKASQGCDWFFHLAAELEEDQPLESLRATNVTGTQNAFWAAKANQCEKFVFLSSVGVYGRFDERAHEMFPYNPLTNYEITKVEAESFVLTHQKELACVVVRSALVMGPNKYWKQIVKTIQKGFPIIGSGNNHWQIVDVSDLVSALIFLAKQKKASGVFNVAEEPDQAKTLKQLVEMIHHEIGSEKKINHIPVWLGKGIAHGATFMSSLQGKKTILRPEYVDRLLKNRHYSIDKIKKLGWKPTYGTQDAITRMLASLEKD